MDSFAVLNSRKRAIIALVHSYVFLVVAFGTNLRRMQPFTLHGPGHVGSVAMLAIYSIVTVVLLLMVKVSGCARERLYFALCTTSAGVGLLRVIVGDNALHGGQYLRVLALALAIVVCTIIARGHADAALTMAVAESD